MTGYGAWRYRLAVKVGLWLGNLNMLVTPLRVWWDSIDFLWLGWDACLFWSAKRITYPSCLRWVLWLGPVYVRRYKRATDIPV